MYTRFKSQKSGIKLGLNTIANTTRSRVVIPQAAASTNSTLTSNVSTTSTALPTANTSLATSTASIVITDCSNLDNFDEKNIFNTENLIPLQHFVNCDQTQTKVGTSRKESNANLNSKINKEMNKNTDEAIDPSYITYVKSTWEKYASEIGTQNGPLKHVDDNSQYPHLNGFVAFDMEHWWAERSISCMINDKSSSSSSGESTQMSISSSSSSLSSSTSSLSPLSTSTLSTSSSLSHSSSSPISSSSKENNLLFNTPINKSFKPLSTKSYPSNPHAMPPLQTLQNNFQLCFS